MNEDEEVMHIDDSIVIDVIVDGLTVTAYFMGGISIREMEAGGVHPGVFDIAMSVPDAGTANVVSLLFNSMREQDIGVSVVVLESGTVQITEPTTGKTLRVVHDAQT